MTQNQIILTIIIYIIGCVLAYGKVNAFLYQLNEDYLPDIKPDYEINYEFGYIFIIIFSWIGFLSTLSVCIITKQKYFLKFCSMKKLWKIYYEHNPKEIV